VASVRLGVVALLPEPVATYVQAWRRSLREPFRDAVPPHITLVPPQHVPLDRLPDAVELVERAARLVAPATIRLRGGASFLPDSPVAFLVVAAGASTLHVLEAALRAPPLDRRTHRFHPHVTIAQDLPAAELEAVVADLADFRAEFGLAEVALMRETAGVWAPERVVRLGAGVTDAPFHTAAAAMLLLLDQAGGRVLLARRSHRDDHRYPDSWEGLGGKPDGNEGLLAALLRETMEEGGVEPLDVSALGCWHDGERADAWYVATRWRGEPRNTDPQEHSTVAWVPLEGSLERPLTPTARRALTELLDLLRPPPG
jgi:2'-5' RNA ligase/8-oxo-dGTP pyrophosphatase MutT (NUDIX family)